MLTVFLATTALVVSGGTFASADTITSAPELDPAELSVEAVTGTDDVLNIAPGEESGGLAIPADADEAAVITAGTTTIAFEQPIAEGSIAEVSDQGTISYRSEESNYDVHLQPVESPAPGTLSDGIRSLIEIQDAEAPKEYTFPVQVAPGTELTVHPDGSVVGTLADEVVLVVPTPWAVAADGSAVPTSYEIRDGALVQHVGFTPENVFPIIADPVWFIPLIIAGARVVAQIAIKAATRAAAKRAAAAAAARIIVKKVRGKILTRAMLNCGAGAGAGGTLASINAEVTRSGDGRWRLTARGKTSIVSNTVGSCLVTRIH